MSSTAKTSLAILASGLLAGALAAQAPPAMETWMIHQEMVQPSKVAQYEATTREFVETVKANRDTAPHFVFSTLMSPDFTYTYALQIPNMAGVDTINGEFGALAQKLGPKWADLSRRNGETLTSVREFVVGVVPSLSYQPATPRLKPGEAKFAHFDFYYVMPGHEDEADKICADFAALYKAKNLPNGYWIMKSVLGSDMPAIIVRTDAKDAADFYGAQAQDMAAIGDAGKALFARAFAITRRFETRDAWLRPDLSLMAVAKK